MDELKVKVNFENPVQVQAVQIPGLPGRDGRDGTPGKDGENGRDGKSAYEVAVDNGFVGTEQEWLESLKGRDGVSGTSEAVSMNFPTVYQMMKNRAMKVDSDSLEDLLKALLREVIPDGRYTSYLAEFKLVDGTSVAVGDTVVHYLLRSMVTRRFLQWSIRPVTTVRPLRSQSRQHRQGEAKKSCSMRTV